MAKVVGVDNFGRDYNGGRSEVLLDSGLTDEMAKALADEKNKFAHPNTDTWYVVKPDDYVLYVFKGY